MESTPLLREQRDLHETQEFVRQLLVNVAQQVLALRASGIMKMEDKQSEKKYDLVTEADGLAEQLIVAALKAQFPHDSITGEEEGVQGNTESDWHWEIDPIDGTINFSRNDECGISVGLLYKGVPVMGVIHYLHDNTQMYAAQGEGAFLYDCTTGTAQRLILEPDDSTLSRCHLTWDSGYGDTVEQLETFSKLKQHALYVTSHACYVTSVRKVLEGQREAYINAGPGPHDVAASAIIALEAGAAVSGIKTEILDFSQKTVPTIIAKSAAILRQIKEVL